MGNSKTREVSLKTNELNEFHNITAFPNEILLKLYDHYRHFSAIQVDDGVIDFEEFHALINKNDKNLTKRIFNAIDTNRDGSINFREFVKFISCFITGGIDEQIIISFKIFSNPDTKSIEEQTMVNLIRDVISAEQSLGSFFTNDVIEIIVKDTFQRICGDENKIIDFDKYKSMVIKYPEILLWLKVDLDRIKKVNFQTKKIKKSICG